MLALCPVVRAMSIETRNPGPITMYGADWCGDCRRAKSWFADNDIEYTYVDLIEQPDETETVLARNAGRKNIPVIVFADDSHLTEPSNADLQAKVDELADATKPAAGDPQRVVVDNVEASRFELRTEPDGELISFADYSDRNGSLVVPHVETLMEHRGNGFAAELMAGVVTNLRSTDRTITPLCPFAAGYLRDRPDTHDLLA